jgi:hypothetical protein
MAKPLWSHAHFPDGKTSTSLPLSIPSDGFMCVVVVGVIVSTVPERDVMKLY